MPLLIPVLKQFAEKFVLEEITSEGYTFHACKCNICYYCEGVLLSFVQLIKTELYLLGMELHCGTTRS